ncbi:hypothetical protein VE00_09038 [Pseudogymnoascus sp. WSF 3629]|nr:hypothetical protein VE00_09038 [Pseudogymnoascus sp. WSF 3629]
MPPHPPAQKGTGKRSGGHRESRRSRSRNTTPSSAGAPGILAGTESESRYLELTMIPFPQASYDDIVDPQIGSSIPDSKAIDTIIDSINRLLDVAEARGAACDRGMRLLSAQRKDQVETERREQERIDREAADEAAERGRQASKMRKKKDTSKVKEDRPLTHGAHVLAPQDGSKIEGAPSVSPGRASQKPGRGRSRGRSRGVSREASASSSLSPVEQTTPPPTGAAAKKKASVPTIQVDEDSSSEDEHQPPPAPAVPHIMTFGDDPWSYPDPTEYEIRKVSPDMPEEEIKKIYSVAEYPHDDLHDLIPGTPPDKDFSNAKPVNQVQATTFATHMEGYLRPFTEEDLAFLRDRGDRVNDFIIPPRGKKHYTEIWAEEDGLADPRQNRDKLPANEPRGSIEDLDEATAETDEISVGPVLGRLLSLLRPENRAPPSEQNVAANGNVDSNADLDSSLGLDPMPLDPPAAPLPPATYMTESTSEGWKKANHPKLDHVQVDERVKQELRYIGLMPESTDPQYDNGEDDEVSARLRLLTAMLKEKVIENNARKAILMEKVKERMAHQEYSTILEDLDSQVQASFSKRTRTMGKKTKAKRPGGAGGGSHVASQGMARPGIGDATKTLMERRKKWIENIGPVFEGDTGRVPRAADEGSSIFTDEAMAEYMKSERENWDEEVDDE